MDDERAFDRLLRRLRKARDLTQEALAQQACCALDTIKKIEAGRRRPSRHLAIQFADVLALDAEERAAFLAAARAGPGDSARPTPTSPGPPAVRTNLPLETLPFIGRAAELAMLDGLLADRSVRVITIAGPGGMGKTRLAVEAARRQLASAHVPDGVFFVSLAALDDPGLMAAPIADALGFSFYRRDQREHWTQDKQPDQLVAYLRDKQLLLVLDNLEQLLSNLSLLSSLVTSAPGVKLLVTSRERLNVRYETVLPLQGLSVLSDDMEEARPGARWGEAVTLFGLAARRAHPELILSAEDSDSVVTICRCVSGMPLGVELAAAWAGVLSPAEIAAEIQTNLDALSSTMRDFPERQRSIRAVFDAAWANLSEAERAGVMQLVVFQGSFTREAALQVAGVSLDVLRSLVQKSLVRTGAAGRYFVHELLRQFASERLAQLPEQLAAAQERHCAYYVTLLAHHEAGLADQRQRDALAAIDCDRYNLIAAWKWAVAQARLDFLEQAMESLCEFHRISGDREGGSEMFHIAISALGWEVAGELAEPLLFEETLDLLERPTTSAAVSDRHRVVLGRLLARWGRFHCESPRVDVQTSKVRDAALRRLSETGARHELAYLVRYNAHLGFSPQESHALYHWALRTFEAHSDAQGIAEIRYRLGTVAARLGDYGEAERMYRDSLTTLHCSGRHTTHANCLGMLSDVYWALGDYQQAEQYNAESYSIAASVGYRAAMAFTKRYSARIALARHDYGTAREYLSESMATYEELGLLGMQAEVLAEYSQVYLLDDGLAEAEQFAQDSLALCGARSYHAGRAEPLIVLGQVACARRDWRAASKALREALAVTRDVYLPPYALHALAGVARLFAAVNKMQRAQGLVAFVDRHPATWHWTRAQLATLAAEPGFDGRWNLSVESRSEQRHDAQPDLWKVVTLVIGELWELQLADGHPQ